MKEFWLIQDNESLRLPVPPKEYGIKTSLNNSSFNVEGLGEVSFIGKPKLAEITPVSSFFPNQAYTFVQYSGYPSPKDCVALIEKWRLNAKPIRYIITESSVNILCSIESFEYKEDDGTKDISFTLELKEYRLLNANSTAVTTTNTSIAYSNLLATQRPVDKAIPTQDIAKPGENLYAFVKRRTGDTTSLYTVAAKNNITDLLADLSGQVITL